MSSSSYNPLYKSREVAPERDEISGDISWTSIQVFLRNRSLRRVFYFAGGASAFFAAWYLYQKLYGQQQLESELSTTSVSGEVGRVAIEEASNNNMDLPGEKSTGQPVEDKVIIHCCPRGYFVPSIATEPLKLETFLRVANIPYEVNFCNEYETPFLTYGDKKGNDFRECIRILSEKFDVSLENKDVTASRKTASHLVDISLENHFAWAILIWRWIFDEGKSMKKIHAMNALGEEVVPEVSQRIKDATRYHPIGQLDKTEFMKTINQGIHDISAALGKHKYFQGQTPGAVDCHAFAILAQIMWNMPGSPFEHQLKKYGNLVEYLRRMKEKFWPDWNELILKPVEFEDNWNTTYKQHHRSPSSSKTRSASRGRNENGENGEDKNNGTEAHSGSDDEGRLPKTVSGTNYSVNPAGNKLPDPEPMTVITKNQVLPNESVQESVQKEPPQPVGILKGVDTAPNSNTDSSVAKPRSGFVTASVGSTKFPVEQVKQNEAPTMSKSPFLVSPLAPTPEERRQQRLQQQCIQQQLLEQQQLQLKQQQQQELQQDSMMQVHKPSVKFADVPSVESTIVGQQVQRPQHQLGVNSEQLAARPPTAQMLTKIGPNYTGSAGEMRSHEQQPPEQIRRPMGPQEYYPNYSQQQLQQIQLLQTGTSIDGYHHNAAPAQYYQQPQPATQTGYGQASYSVSPQMSTNQGTSPYAQHFASQQAMGHSGNDSLQTLPNYGPEHTLNPEQMQKAAQAHLNAYYHQYQQYQQQQQQQTQYNSSNYHTTPGIVPSFVNPPVDPRNPTAALLRF